MFLWTCTPQTSIRFLWTCRHAPKNGCPQISENLVLFGGLIPPNSTLTPRFPSGRAWRSWDGRMESCIYRYVSSLGVMESCTCQSRHGRNVPPHPEPTPDPGFWNCTCHSRHGGNPSPRVSKLEGHLNQQFVILSHLLLIIVCKTLVSTLFVLVGLFLLLFTTCTWQLFVVGGGQACVVFFSTCVTSLLHQ